MRIKRLSDSQVLAACMLFATAPLFFWLPIWISAWCLGFLFIQLIGAAKRLHVMLSSAFALLGLVVLVSSYGTRYSLDFCVALLALLAAIKPLEVGNHRDKAVTLCMAYFVTLSGLWYSNVLGVALYSAIALVITTSALGYVNGAFESLSNSSRLAFRVMLQALPVALVIFVVFPRLSGGLWGLNVSTSSKTGFSDSVSLGDVSSLAQDRSVAFRAEFEDKIPDLGSLYWRGIVFSQFNGRKWIKSVNPPEQKGQLVGLDPINYRVILEAHGRNWLFSLDFPRQKPSRSIRTVEGVITSRAPVTERKMYKLTSVSTKSEYLDAPMRRTTTKYPTALNPKTQQLVASWLSQDLKPAEIMEKAMRFFSDSGIKYTLTPQLTSGHHVDDFLFRTKEGYCEHIASAFALMMRYAKIPSRLVGGYYGGERNPNGNLLIVRQSSAHVWVEVWLREHGWLRVDPTTGVTNLAEQQARAGADSANRRMESQMSFVSRTYENIKMKIDAMNFAWNKWVLGYTREKQLALLEKLGLSGQSLKTSLIIFGAIGLTLGLALLASFLFNVAGRKAPIDRIGKTYQKLLHKFERVGLRKPPAMGPQNYQKQVEELFPELEDSIDQIMQLYIKLRYSDEQQEGDVENFASMVRELKPRSAKTEEGDRPKPSLPR